MKVQHVDALMVQTAMGLPKQLVPARQRQGWLVRRSSKNHSFSGQRGATRVIATCDDSWTRAITRPTRGKGGNAYRSRSSQGWRNASSKTAWGSGTSEQYRGSFALRHVANRSIDGLPHTRRSSLATAGWSDHSVPTTCPRRLRISATTLLSPGRYLASRWTSKLSVHLRRQLVSKHRARETVTPLFVDVRHYRGVVEHRGHMATADIFSKGLKTQEQGLHFEKIDVQATSPGRTTPRTRFDRGGEHPTPTKTRPNTGEDPAQVSRIEPPSTGDPSPSTKTGPVSLPPAEPPEAREGSDSGDHCVLRCHCKERIRRRP